MSLLTVLISVLMHGTPTQRRLLTLLSGKLPEALQMLSGTSSEAPSGASMALPLPRITPCWPLLFTPRVVQFTINCGCFTIIGSFPKVSCGQTWLMAKIWESPSVKTLSIVISRRIGMYSKTNNLTSSRAQSPKEARLHTYTMCLMSLNRTDCSLSPPAAVGLLEEPEETHPLSAAALPVSTGH